MKRRAKPQRNSIRKENRTASGSLALVLIDGTRIRQQIRRDYEKVLRDLGKARQQLDHFHQEDLPRFARWFNSHFGALLTELREISHRIQEKEQLLFELESELLFGETSAGQAYERVMRRREKAAEGESEMPEPDDDGPEEQFRPNDEEFDEAYRESARSQRRAETRRRQQPPEGESSRLKSLYRALVRLLHPDKQRRLTPQMLEWWHETQAAYQSGNVEQLEVILSLCEIDQTGSTDKASVGLLQRIAQRFRRSLRQIKAQLTQCRRQPAWNFSKRTDHAVMERTTRLSLQHDLEMLKRQLQGMEEEIALWSAQSRRGSRRGSRRRRRDYPDPFDIFFS